MPIRVSEALGVILGTGVRTAIDMAMDIYAQALNGRGLELSALDYIEDIRKLLCEIMDGVSVHFGKRDRDGNMLSNPFMPLINLLLLSALVLRCTAAESPRGHWLLDKFLAEGNCDGDSGLGLTNPQRWNEVHAFVTGAELPFEDASLDALLSRVLDLLSDVLVPYGIPDPTIALECPLGTSSLLHVYAEIVLASGGDAFGPRALRIIHLAKLLYFHRFGDLGDAISISRWPVDLSRLVALASQLRQAEAADWRTNKEAYAQLRGYGFSRSPANQHAHAWRNKIEAIQRRLQQGNGLDWVMWVDCDAFFMNPDETIEDFVERWATEEDHLLISEDANMLNSAVFLLRNSDWSRALLNRVLSLLDAPSPFSYRDNQYHEQSPLQYLLLVPGILDLSSNSTGYAAGVRLVPQKSLNAYPKETALRSSIMVHDVYEEGDWIVSFNGCGSLLDNPTCERMLAEHHRVSMEKLSKGRPRPQRPWLDRDMIHARQSGRSGRPAAFSPLCSRFDRGISENCGYSPLIKRNRIPFINFETGAPKADMSQPSVVTPFTQEKTAEDSQTRKRNGASETLPRSRHPTAEHIPVPRRRSTRRLMTGQIGVFHRGGGHRQRLRLIDYKRGRKDIYATVLRIEYCPGRTSFLALIQYTDGVLSYIVAPETLRPGDRVVASETAPIIPGNCLPLRNIPAGTIIHNLEPRPGAGGQINRSAGCFAAIMSKDTQWATIKLNSTEIKRFPLDCWAVVGQVGNANFWARAKGHCRVKRWLGWRPSVHGVAKNPSWSILMVAVPPTRDLSGIQCPLGLEDTCLFFLPFTYTPSRRLHRSILASSQTMSNSRNVMLEGGQDTDGHKFTSLQDMWSEKLSAGSDEWYGKAVSYWQNQPSSDDGVLQGFEGLSPTDVMGSLKFLDTIERRVPNPPMFRTVADCGAGIGRVSREVLTQRFQTIDLVEPCANLLESAQKTLNPAATAPCRVERFLQMGVQDFNPELGRYDVIWNQWCLLYLTDEDLVAYLKRCKAALAPKDGVIVVKENVVIEGKFVVDKDDNSITRTDSQYKTLFARAGLHLVLEMLQPHWPNDLFPVKMYCLR
ncbi:Alpha N-terminal protein methyltransferase 1B [Perkinsus olseni]|uniref:Alpha N-terminal protein methyltransferase 1 n=1 Tax=Perkinsus olseni TaxID=32597 RepID=A0A7J6PL82_PEROL|nr:Alpha N-terminal protein methyltransferase 1B [Perkinsus olseni]